MLFSTLCFAKAAPKPDWVEDWRRLYPDSTYIAQVGASTQSAETAKLEAVNRIAEYLKTGVTSNTQTSTVNTTVVDNNKTKTSSVKENSKIVTLSVDLSLSALEYTEAWYDKKTKTYYVLAYVSRQKAWEVYKPTVEDAKKEFYALYNKAKAEKEPLLSCIYYQSAKTNSRNFLSTLDFAHLINPITDMEYANDRSEISSIPAIVKSKILGCTMFIFVEGDVNSIVKSGISNAFSTLGFMIQETGALYTVDVVVEPNEVKQQFGAREMYIVTPSVTVSINNNQSISIYKYIYTSETQTKNFSLEKALAGALPVLSQKIQSTLPDDFREKTGLDRFIF